MRTITTIGLVALLAAAMPPAGARGGHGHGSGHSHGMHAGGTIRGGGSAGNARHGNDAYTKAASDEEDRLLNGKLKSICRGC
ncbi:hypothetical protein H8A95_02150 [Bradyrhizobium sp. Pear76]|uniref:hypothetical protein n=1 Tax=Bradyrhizobium oropedii TaxID=1571201 RepID=UPI001E3AF177|nr:hypothetical protein [Bradyrhizobium oropedii]MCC8961142.1 hypothetical protein [Bradyrhizobium oropedii]